MEDANRDPVTGEYVVEEVVVESNEEAARAESDDEAEGLSESEEPDANEIDSDDSEGVCTWRRLESSPTVLM